MPGTLSVSLSVTVSRGRLWWIIYEHNGVGGRRVLFRGTCEGPVERWEQTGVGALLYAASEVARNPDVN